MAKRALEREKAVCFQLLVLDQFHYVVHLLLQRQLSYFYFTYTVKEMKRRIYFVVGCCLFQRAHDASGARCAQQEGLKKAQNVTIVS